MPYSAWIYEQNNGQIVNNGTIDFQGDGQYVYHDTGTVGTLTNNGLLKKSSGTGRSTISLELNNNGAVQVDSGKLALSTGSFATGTSFSGAGTIGFWSGLNVIAGNPGVKLLSGTITFNSTTADFGSSNITFSSLAQTSGTLTGTGAVTASTITWSGGTMSGTGTTVIPAGGTMTVAGGSYLDGRTITNNGAIKISSNAYIYEQNSGQIVNNGTIDFQGDGQFYHDTGTVGTLTNNGLLKKSSGTGRSYISLFVSNNGTVQADSGTLVLQSSFVNAVAGHIQGTATLGLAPNSTFTNNGTTKPGAVSPGKLNIEGNYSLPTESTLSIRVGGTTVGTRYDQLAISGNVALGGKLAVSLVNSFIPAVGNSFTILTSAGASGITGTFSLLDLPDLAVGKVWKTGFSKGAVTLTINSASVISVSPLTLDFGNLPINTPSTAKTFTITNNGTVNLITNSIVLSGTHAGMFATDSGSCGSLPATIIPGSNCTFTVTFTPTSAVVADATVTISSNDPRNPALPIKLGGTGVYALTASLSGSNGNISGPTTAAAGSNAQFTIIPANGYRINTLTDNGSPVRMNYKIS